MTESEPQSLTIVVEREFAHPPDKLWRALTQPHLIEEWLMKNDFQPTLGYRFKLSANWGGVLDCEVLAIEPNETLSYSWDLADAEAPYDLKSTVTFTLVPTSTGTLLRMEQSGFRRDQRQAYGGAKSGWPQFLAKLDQVLEREA